MIGNIYDNIETYLEPKSKYLKSYEKEYESKFNDFRDEDVVEKENIIIKKLGQLAIHQLKKQLKLDKLLWDFDSVSLYPSAMWDEKSIYPKTETGYAYAIDMNEEIVEKFNTGNFTQGSAILKIK